MKVSKQIGILDIGTNSVMLTIGIADPEKPTQLTEFFEVTRLGERVGETGRLLTSAMDRTLHAAEKFVKKARTMGVRHFTGTATSAARDAANGEEFLKMAHQRLGFTPKILSGPEEARLVFLGSTADLPAGEKVITVDPGGGSTEINIGYVGETPLYSYSFNAGCVRQADAYNLYEKADESQISKAQVALRDLFQPAFKSEAAEGAETILISGGTSTTYGAVQIGMTKYDWEKVHHLTSSRTDLEACYQDLFSKTSEERAKIAGLSDGRAAVLPTGLLIINEVLKGFGFDQFTITTRALRYGILVDESRKLDSAAG